MFSSKFGKKAPLEISRLNQYRFRNTYSLFLESLVCDKSLVVNAFSSIREQEAKPVCSNSTKSRADYIQSSNCCDLISELKEELCPYVSSKLFDIENHLK